MKLEINQNILLEHLTYIIKGISNKNIRPILNCIKFNLTKEGLYLYSTDNEISIRTFIEKNKIKKIEEEGKIVITGRYIYEIIRKLPDEIIKIEEVMDSKVYITTKSSSFNLNCNDVSEFPELKLEYGKNPIILKNKIFKKMVNQTIFATSLQESRPVLTGINIKIKENTLICTATDSYRLAIKKIKLDKKYDEVNIIIPNKNIQELIKLLPDDESNIEIHIFNNKILFKFNSIIFTSRLINGTYPETSKLIPKSFDLVLKIKYNDFYNAIDRASLLTNEEDKNTIKMEIDDKEAVISSNIPEIGNVTEKIKISKNNSEKFKIAFSSKFMMDALKIIENDELEIYLNGELKPIIINNPETDNLIQLILPIRTY